MQEATVIETGERVKLLSRSITQSVGELYEVESRREGVRFYFEWQLRGLTREKKQMVPILYDTTRLMHGASTVH